jgi:large subunit ribosomal protein L22
MSTTVKQRFIHMTARKLRLVADSVRGKSTDVALAELMLMPRTASKPIAHAVRSAIASAKRENPDQALKIESIFIDEGPALKRRIFKSRGRATRMEHRMSHLTVTVAPTEAKATRPTRKTVSQEIV